MRSHCGWSLAEEPVQCVAIERGMFELVMMMG